MFVPDTKEQASSSDKKVAQQTTKENKSEKAKGKEETKKNEQEKTEAKKKEEEEKLKAEEEQKKAEEEAKANEKVPAEKHSQRQLTLIRNLLEASRHRARCNTCDDV